jgi:hypothetical protein
MGMPFTHAFYFHARLLGTRARAAPPWEGVKHPPPTAFDDIAERRTCLSRFRAELLPLGSLAVATGPASAPASTTPAAAAIAAWTLLLALTRRCVLGTLDQLRR